MPARSDATLASFEPRVHRELHPPSPRPLSGRTSARRTHLRRLRAAVHEAPERDRLRRGLPAEAKDGAAETAADRGVKEAPMEVGGSPRSAVSVPQGGVSRSLGRWLP